MPADVAVVQQAKKMKEDSPGTILGQSGIHDGLLAKRGSQGMKSATMAITAYIG